MEVRILEAPQFFLMTQLDPKIEALLVHEFRPCVLSLAYESPYCALIRRQAFSKKSHGNNR